ncbi:MAG: sulfurtransferase complex subunit TusB [Gammaproteobacteria bacterium]|nr:sulfurtransferase complex subunit TusB [Gammaproteobacteria bacterium]
MLHTVNRSPFEKSSLESALRLAKPGSALLLLEDAVYAAVTGTVLEERMREAARRLRVHVLGPDLQARGLEEGALIEGIGVVDYGGFVDLAVENDKVQAWV